MRYYWPQLSVTDADSRYGRIVLRWRRTPTAICPSRRHCSLSASWLEVVLPADKSYVFSEKTAGVR